MGCCFFSLKFQCSLFLVIRVGILYLLRLVLYTLWNVPVQGALILKRMKAGIAHVHLVFVVCPVANEGGHVLYPDVVVFGWVFAVVEEHEVHVSCPVSVLAEIQHAEPFALEVPLQNIDGYCGVVFLECGDQFYGDRIFESLLVNGALVHIVFRKTIGVVCCRILSRQHAPDKARTNADPLPFHHSICLTISANMVPVSSGCPSAPSATSCGEV